MKDREKIKIKTPMSKLIEVFGINSDEVTHYLNIENGKIAIHSNICGAFDEDGNEIKRENPFASKKYLELPGFLSYEAFMDMERFTETVTDEQAQNKLIKVLSGKNPIQRFYKILESNPDLDKEWHRYRENCLRLRIIDWLNDNNLQLVEF